MHRNNATHTAPSTGDQKKIEPDETLQNLRKSLMARKAAIARPETPAETPNKAQTPQACDPLGLESLLEEGKAVAEALVAMDKLEAAVALVAANHSQSDPIQQLTSPPRVSDIDYANHNSLAAKEAGYARPDSTPTSLPNATNVNVNTPESRSRPVESLDSYYDDVATWLEFTGYHDVPFRKSKLDNYKERHELQQ